ncbi:MULTISPECIES: hypothetical protein [unclassified Isoptericola]|uniref:hypothetical protein n=1 Tax=unclassified Isoptericola TaxID=2623355 RepID=UPI0036502E54
MTLDAHDVRELAAGLSSPTSESRDLAAEKVTDWLAVGIDPTRAAALSRALEVAISLEDDERALEAQLNALSEVSALGLVPRDVLARVIASRAWDERWATAFVEGLREDLAVAPDDDPSRTAWHTARPSSAADRATDRPASR